MDMNAIIAQVVAGILIILLGIFIYRHFPLRADGKTMILGALFIILSLIVSMFTVRIPLFGIDSLRIGFTQVMLVVGGSLIAPGWAFIMGIVYDLLGLLVNPTSFPFLGFTLGNILVCVIPSLWYHSSKTKKLTDHNMMMAVDISLVILCILSILFIVVNDEVNINSSAVPFELWMKFTAGFICIAVSSILILVLHFIKNKMPQANLHELTNWMMVVLLIEVCIQFGCTPIWLQVMYGIPWAASLFVRIVKACVMIPLNVLLGYNILKVVRRIKA